MSLSRFYSPFPELDNLFDELARARAAAPVEETKLHLLKPRMNLHEDVEGNLVTATFELPGLSKDKVNIDVHNNHLTISGEVAESSELSQGGYKIKERRSGKFSRTLQLPEGTQADTIKASMEGGVLTVAFPRSSPGQEPQRITIN